MPRYKEKDYSLLTALKNIGDFFWRNYQDDLRIYAEKVTDILECCEQAIIFLFISRHGTASYQRL